MIIDEVYLSTSSFKKKTLFATSKFVAFIGAIALFSIMSCGQATDSVMLSHMPKDAHCYEVYITGGTSNPFWVDHGYQYQPPTWTSGPCPSLYNFFNRNVTLAAGVTERVMGILNYTNPPAPPAKSLRGSNVVESSSLSGDMLYIACKNPSNCLQLDIPGGYNSPFWAAMGYKYRPDHPECSASMCDHSVYPYLNSTTDNVTGVTLLKYGA